MGVGDHFVAGLLGTLQGGLGYGVNAGIQSAVLEHNADRYGRLLNNRQAGGVFALSQHIGSPYALGNYPQNLYANPALSGLLPLLASGLGNCGYGGVGGSLLGALYNGGLPGLIQGLIMQQLLGSLGGCGCGQKAWNQEIEYAYAKGRLDGFSEGVVRGVELGTSIVG